MVRSGCSWLAIQVSNRREQRGEPSECTAVTGVRRPTSEETRSGWVPGFPNTAQMLRNLVVGIQETSNRRGPIHLAER